MTSGPNRLLIARGILEDIRQTTERQVPGEVRAWHGADAHTAGAVAEFIVRLACWERTGTGEAWDQMCEGYSGVIDAWTSTISAYYSSPTAA